MKTVLRDCNAKVGKESYLYPVCGGHSIHNETNHIGKWMVNCTGRDFALMGINMRTLTRSLGDHLTTNCVTR